MINIPGGWTPQPDATALARRYAAVERREWLASTSASVLGQMGCRCQHCLWKRQNPSGREQKKNGRLSV